MRELGSSQPTAVDELQGSRFVLALGVNDGSLLARIRRIVDVGPDRTPPERWSAALLGLVLLGAMCALSITWSVAAPDDVRHEPQPVVGPTPEREQGQLQELVAWSADSAQVFTTTTFIRLMRWERNGTALNLKASEIPGNEAFAHANSMAIGSRSGQIVLGTNRGTVQFWDADLLQVQKQIAVEPDTDRYPTHAVAVSPDESVVAEFGWSGHLYDMATMKCICLFGEREKRRMSVLAFAPNGRTLVGLDWDGLLTLWNIPDGTRIADWPLRHIAQHATVQWSPEGDLIAVVSDGTVTFVTPTVGSTPRVVVAPEAVCQLTPVDTLIESRVRRVDLPHGIDFAGVMALAPDFKTVASVKIDASVAIWDVETREVISHLAAPPSARDVDYAGVYMQRLTFSPNGRQLACTRDVEGDLIYWTLNAEPVENARVRIRNADGSPAALNGLVNAPQVIAAAPRPAATDEAAPEKGLEFLKSYPNLHGLSLAMTEPQFRAFAKRGELTLQITPRDKDRSTYSIPTGDGHSVIVTFQSGKCRGIQRIRGEDRVDKVTFESIAVTFKAALGNDQPQQIQIKADGSCVYYIDGRPARGDIQKRPEARLTSKISPQRMLELERLLAKTNWLTVAGGEGPPRHTDA